MTDHDVLEWIWKWTIIPLFVTFLISCVVVFVSLAGHVLGDDGALRSDTFRFFALLAPSCLLLYGFFRAIRWIVSQYISSKE